VILLSTNFGKFLIEFMEKNDYKLEYVAEKTNTSFSTIGHYRTGRRLPKDDFIEKFIKAFNFTEQEKKYISDAVLKDRTPPEILDKLEKFERYSKIENAKGNARRIDTVKVPLYGTASAGPGYLNLDIELKEFIIPKEDYREGRFTVKVEGNSMTGPIKSIPCGSVALADPNMCTDIEELIGRVCVFTYNDETFIKQLTLDRQNLIHLVSFNPEEQDIIVLNPKMLKCNGRVVKTYYEQRW
jgi:phage repressor protein C with HTH and peptisase S24 domain